MRGVRSGKIRRFRWLQRMRGVRETSRVTLPSNNCPKFTNDLRIHPPRARTCPTVAPETHTACKVLSRVTSATRTTITIPPLRPQTNVSVAPPKAPHVPIMVSDFLSSKNKASRHLYIICFACFSFPPSSLLHTLHRWLHARDALSEKKLLACHKNWPRDLRVPD